MNQKTKIIISIAVLSLILFIAILLLNNQFQQKPLPLQQETPQNNSNPLIGKIEIIDGDTFKTPEGETIRLLCVDTPEKNQEGYEEATNFLTEKLLYEDIKLEGNKTDKYGRSLRWVYVNNALLNKEIIDLGYGILFEYDGEDCGRVK